MRNAKLVYMLIFCYCLTSILLPVFVLNKLLFVPLILASVYAALSAPVRTLSPFIIFSVFLYGFVLSLFSHSDLALARQMLLGSTTLFFIFLIDDQAIDMTSILKGVGGSFALIMTLFSCALLLMPTADLSQYLLNYYMQHELGFYGIRQFGSLQMFMLHHRASPFLLIPLALFFLSFLDGKWRDGLWASLILLCIFFTASRGLMLMGAFMIVALFYFRSPWRLRLLTLAVTVPLTMGILFYLVTHTAVFSPTETSNGIKLGHLLSFYEQIDARSLLTGNGMGNYFYTSGYNRWVAQTEITWMDSLRFFGLPLTFVLLVAIIFPSRYVRLGDWSHSSARIMVLIYLIMSLSNPVLFNSFGFIVVLWFWSSVLTPRIQVAPHLTVQQEGIAA
ncbi:hypothetical protein [Pseudomonas cremoricolorata]|uniref:hypothetical protein n=1 Tax=Pseudomonas cremoricolorata TaxID=157783 RepID=UPI00040A132C|nr:hypothetical protein [Pseudomonas cremoricolorata]